ncbi:hypothetical protein SDC9_181668 [bioreactor metagenome]|uniref:Uncharacterized protein n=1 Tax=bioreactor metagenome TaxID=1076179 RepID=A0A645H5A0_9ZZZZ
MRTAPTPAAFLMSKVQPRTLSRLPATTPPTKGRDLSSAYFMVRKLMLSTPPTLMPRRAMLPKKTVVIPPIIHLEKDLIVAAICSICLRPVSPPTICSTPALMTAGNRTLCTVLATVPLKNIKSGCAIPADAVAPTAASSVTSRGESASNNLHISSTAPAAKDNCAAITPLRAATQTP